MGTSLLDRVRRALGARPLRPAAAAERTAPPAPRPVADAVTTLDDLAALSGVTDRPGWRQGAVLRMTIFAVAPQRDPAPLIPGTLSFCEPGIAQWHEKPYPVPPRDIACYFVRDAVVSGTGQVWLDERLITAPDLMPQYVRAVLGLEGGGNDQLRRSSSLPVRDVEAPCVAPFVHGVHVYGHFLIEALFRILTARRALAGSSAEPAILLDQDAPPWLLDILRDDLGIPHERLVFFRPAAERVRLRHALLPTLTYWAHGFHPSANEELSLLIAALAGAVPPRPHRRIFVARRGFRNRHSSVRSCLNEAELIAIAKTRFGFEPVNVETLPWREQLALFRDAEIAIGPWGSAMHGALFSAAGTRVGVLGFMSHVQSQIGALRGHRNAYLTRGVDLSGDFSVDPGLFDAFLGATCDASV